MAGISNWVVTGSGQVPLLAGVGLLFAASVAAVDALSGASALTPGRRAIAHWIPIAATALVAVLCHHGELALAVIFATSVASLSLVLGSIVLAEPQRSDAPEAWRRLWPFVLPAALLALMAGFAGRLRVVHAIVFLIEGLVLLAAWMERKALVSAEASREVSAGNSWPAAAAPKRINGLNLSLGIILAILGAVAAVAGTVKLSQRLPTNASGLVVALFLGPLLVAPMLFGGANFARQGHGWAATTTGVGVVLLNLCLLLPAVVLLWYPVSTGHIDWAHLSLHIDSMRDVPGLIYSIVTWRVDTVILVLLGFVLLAVSVGRWQLGRAEGVVLIALYAVYILMETTAGMHA